MNEISPTGQVLHLTNLQLPPKIQQRRDKNATEKSAGSGEDGIRVDIDATTAVLVENDGAAKEDGQAFDEVCPEYITGNHGASMAK